MQTWTFISVILIKTLVLIERLILNIVHSECLILKKWYRLPWVLKGFLKVPSEEEKEGEDVDDVIKSGKNKKDFVWCYTFFLKL